MSDKELYYVHGRYIALNKDGSHAGEAVYIGEQEAESEEMAIKQAAVCLGLEHNYRAITWLYAMAESMEGMSRWRKAQLFLVAFLDRRRK